MLRKSALEVLTSDSRLLDLAFPGKSAVVRSVHQRPGGAVTVGYGPEGGSARYFIATDKAGSLSYRGLRLTSWTYPADPHLPLGSVAAFVSRELGGGYQLRQLGYRPGRRAVFAVFNEDGVSHYLKVLREKELNRILGNHLACSAAGVASAPVVAHSSQMLLTAALPGQPLHSFLGPGAPLGEIFASLEVTLDSLPGQLATLPRRSSWADNASSYAKNLGRALPELAARANDVAAAIAQLRQIDEPLVVTHGDFYEANVLICDGRVSGVLDLDSLGPGYRSDDWATLLGHLSVLPTLSRKYAEARSVQRLWYIKASAEVDPAVLAASAAGVVLSLASATRQRGAANWQAHARARLAVAQNWIDIARMV